MSFGFSRFDQPTTVLDDIYGETILSDKFLFEHGGGRVIRGGYRLEEKRVAWSRSDELLVDYCSPEMSVPKEPAGCWATCYVDD